MATNDQTPPGWYHAEGDAPGTKRYWDGAQWTTEPQVMMESAAVGGLATDNVASAGQRIGGRIIDFILLGIVLVAISLVLILPSMDFDAIIDAVDAGVDPPDDALPSSGAIGLTVLVTTAISFLWEYLWTKSRGATPGKLLVGTRVVEGTKAPGDGLESGTAAKRAANKLLGLLGAIPLIGGLASLASIIIGLVSVVMLFSDDARRTVMDRFGGTRVVKKS